ncbi:hypothetical protein KCP70_07030 [Salmonella enterica subsp. enterica]|nr:hypothetical protein KCP70_07030 [Salmonella enterica subsp. enterica]
MVTVIKNYRPMIPRMNFIVFPDIKSESNVSKDIYMSAESAVIIIGCFISGSGYFINRKKMMISLSNQITHQNYNQIKAMKKSLSLVCFILPLKANIIPSISLPDKLRVEISQRMLRITQGLTIA